MDYCLLTTSIKNLLTAQPCSGQTFSSLLMTSLLSLITENISCNLKTGYIRITLPFLAARYFADIITSLKVHAISVFATAFSEKGLTLPEPAAVYGGVVLTTGEEPSFFLRQDICSYSLESPLSILILS